MDKKRYHVLIVEDSPEDRETYRRLLTRADEAEYRFSETDSGEEGLRLCRELHPDCVLLDYQLPDADGLALLAELARPSAEGLVPVLMLTGQGDEAVAVQAMKRGAQDYLIKDRMTPAELSAAVQNAIAKVGLRRQVERARELFRLAVEASPSAMVMVDAQGRVVLANVQAERSFGYARDELLGRSVEVLIPTRFRAECPGPCAALAAAQARARGAGDELCVCKKDGTEFPVEIALTPLETDEGPMTLSSIVDVTERKRAEEERRRLERRVQETQHLESLGVLAGGVAHRFNNLLVGVLGNASLALDLTPGDWPARATLEGIVDSAQRAADLCGQMLFFSGRGRFVVGPLDLSAAVERMKPLLDVTAGSATVVYELATGLPPVEADAAQIRQLVLNLLTNAAEATGGRGGVIRVATAARPCTREELAEAHRGEELPEGVYVCLEVRDNGSGMTGETLGKIFDPFFTTKFTGRGLGLAAALGIVRGHRGAIRVASTPGRGSTFRVFLPAQGPALAAAAPVPAAAAGGLVLVVDDDEMVRGVTAAALRTAGVSVLTAGSGREAVEIVRARGREVGLVLLDLMMPGMGGEETLGELRRVYPGLPVLLVSGYSEREAAARFTGPGVSGFIQKPWQVPDLLGRVRRVLGGSGGK